MFFVIETKGQGKNQVSTVYVEGYLVGRELKSNKSTSPTLILRFTVESFFPKFTYSLIKINIY